MVYFSELYILETHSERFHTIVFTLTRQQSICYHFQILQKFTAKFTAKCYFNCFTFGVTEPLGRNTEPFHTSMLSVLFISIPTHTNRISDTTYSLFVLFLFHLLLVLDLPGTHYEQFFTMFPFISPKLKL